MQAKQGFMFLFKNIVLICFFLSYLFCSCTTKKTEPAEIKADSSAFLIKYRSYDSLFNVFFKTRDIKFLNQAGLFADSALEMPAITKDSILQKKYFSLLFYRAVDLNILGQYIKSKDFLENYIHLYLEHHLTKEEDLSDAQKILANIYSRYGDYKKAVLLLQESLAYYSGKKKEEEIASCILNLAISLKELQRYDEADSVLQKIFELPSVSPKRKGRACIELADIYIRRSNTIQAGLQILKARQFLDSVAQAPERTEAFTRLLNIEGDWHMAGNNPSEAVRSYQRSIDSAKISSSQNLRNREVGKTYIAMGRAFVQLRSYDSALWFYNRALYTVVNIDTLDRFSLPKQKELYAENTIAEALYARADCIIATGTENIPELENSVSCYKLAFETERKLLDAFSYDESRQQMLEATRKQSEKAINTCYRLYQKTKNSRWANEAFLFAEHNKAFILTESVRRNTAASLYLQNDSLYEKLQSLKGQLSMIETELGKQHASGKPDTLLTRSLSEARKKNEVALLEAENSLRMQNPAYANWLAGNSSLTAEELVSKTTTSGNSFIEYFTADSSVYAFSGEKNKPLAFYKLQAGIKNKADALLLYFSNRNAILNDPAGYAAIANSLYKLVLAPYVSTGNSTLLIIPDGFVSRIPFDALLTGPAASANISAFPFLIKKQQTGYAFSCRTLIEQSNSANTVNKNNIAAFAPVFTNRERGLSPLSNSLGELDAVKQFYPEGKFFSAATATIKGFEDNCSNSAIIHLATHAGTGNNTAMPGIEFYDSTLYLNRIYTLPLKASLVVLSGCETGAGSINRTEGLMSLARGFSYAGTKNVIGSLWPTDDRVSADMFKHFYSNLNSHDFSTALHKAKLAVIDNSSTASASPYFWSGYIYIGSPEANSKSGSFGWVKYTLIASGLLAIAAFFALRRKRKN